jgi:hypothetical protein
MLAKANAASAIDATAVMVPNSVSDLPIKRMVSGRRVRRIQGEVDTGVADISRALALADKTPPVLPNTKPRAGKAVHSLSATKSLLPWREPPSSNWIRTLVATYGWSLSRAAPGTDAGGEDFRPHNRGFLSLNSPFYCTRNRKNSWPKRLTGVLTVCGLPLPERSCHVCQAASFRLVL